MSAQSENTQASSSAGNTCDQSTISFCFKSDWLRKWREFSGPVTWQSKGKPKESRVSSKTSYITENSNHFYFLHLCSVQTNFILQNRVLPQVISCRMDLVGGGMTNGGHTLKVKTDLSLAKSN